MCLSEKVDAAVAEMSDEADEQPYGRGQLDADIQAMAEPDLLEQIRIELLRDGLQGLRHGTITHQEKAILRGLLRDNKSTVEKPGAEKKSSRHWPQSQPEFTQPDYGDTDGG
jgi:hypothetical protein